MGCDPYPHHAHGATPPRNFWRPLACSADGVSPVVPGPVGHAGSMGHQATKWEINYVQFFRVHANYVQFFHRR